MAIDKLSYFRVKEITMSFSENLIELRKYHDFSQEELAEKIGVSRQTLSK